MTVSHPGFATAAAALLCDRDGTLVSDVPYNDDPDAVEPLPGVAAALARARAAGLRVGIVTNQRGVALGRITPARLAAVNARVDELLGPFDVIVWCPHGAEDGCRCRKPNPGLVLDAARRLRLPTAACVVVGDSWSDVAAAWAAGAGAVLIGSASVPDFATAVDVVLARCEAA